MFSFGNKSEIGDPCECVKCHRIFTRLVDDEEVCLPCQELDEGALSDPLE